MKQLIGGIALGLLVASSQLTQAEDQKSPAKSQANAQVALLSQNNTAVAPETVEQMKTDATAAIRKMVKSYVAAFDAKDAKALAAHWSPDGVYISRLDGSAISGRNALEQEFAAQFEEGKNTKLEVTTESIDFISPNVALEQGTATVITPDAKPSLSSYSVVHVKRDGKWLIDRVSEEEVAEPASHFQQLEDLEWMIGEWIDQEGGNVIKTECKWTRNRNFITRTFTATVGDRIDLTGIQFVGWDAARKQIRSWVFDSEGGWAEGVWTKSGERWLVQSTATMPDGRRGSSTSILKPTDDGSFSWQKVNRVVDGEILPNIDEVVIVRQ